MERTYIINYHLELEKQTCIVEEQITKYPMEERPKVLAQLLSAIQDPGEQFFIEHNIDPRLLPKQTFLSLSKSDLAQRIIAQNLETKLESAQVGSEAQYIVNHALKDLAPEVQEAIQQKIAPHLRWKTKGWCGRNERYITCVIPTLAGMCALVLCGAYGITSLGIYLFS